MLLVVIVLLIYGLGFLFIPNLLVSLFRGNYVDLNWLRWSGGAILALGIDTLMVYNNPEKQGIFVTTMTLVTLFTGLGLFYSWIM